MFEGLFGRIRSIVRWVARRRASAAALGAAGLAAAGFAVLVVGEATGGGGSGFGPSRVAGAVLVGIAGGVWIVVGASKGLSYFAARRRPSDAELAELLGLTVLGTVKLAPAATVEPRRSKSQGARRNPFVPRTLYGRLAVGLAALGLLAAVFWKYYVPPQEPTAAPPPATASGREIMLPADGDGDWAAAPEGEARTVLVDNAGSTPGDR